jgi:hypothetical protein
LYTDGFYRVVIRSRDELSGGTTSLEVNGQIEATNLPFGGRFRKSDWSANEILQAVNKSDKGDDGIDTLLLTTDSSKDNNLHFDDDSGIYLSPRIKTGSSSVTGGWIVLGKFSSYGSMQISFPVKQVIVYRNDRGDSSGYQYVSPSACLNINDADCDGLGNKLEQSVGTCSCVIGKDSLCNANVPGYCSSGGITFDARDTDGDGIPDNWEIFGRKLDIYLNGSLITLDHELPRYGANPRHKDVFIECDRISSTQNFTAVELQNIIAHVKDGPGDSQNLKNPDGLKGIHLHFDINGFSSTAYPNSAGDVHSYGDWGGSSVYNSNSGAAHLSLERVGIWRLADIKSAGHSGVGDFMASTNSVKIFVHEFGHMLGLVHGGDPKEPFSYNGAANYDSIMSYSSGAPDRFTAGKLPSINPSKLIEKLGMTNTGVSVDDYLYLENLNGFNIAVDIDPNSPTYGAIDWNRDGLYNPGSSVQVKGFVYDGYAYQDGLNKDLIALYQAELSNVQGTGLYIDPSSKIVTGGVEIAFFKQDLYLLTIVVENSNTKFLLKKKTGNTWSTPPQPVQSSDLLSGDTPAMMEASIIESCTVSFDCSSAGSTCVNNSCTIPSKRLYVVYRKNESSGPVLYSFYFRENGTFSTPVSLNSMALSSPSLRRMSNGLLALYYIDNSNTVYKKELLLNGVWSTSSTAQTVGSFLISSKYGPNVVTDGVGNDYLLVSNIHDSKLVAYKKNGNNSWIYSRNWNIDVGGRISSLYDPASVSNNRTGYPVGLHVWYKDSSYGKFSRIFSNKLDGLNLSSILYCGVSFSGTLNGDPSIAMGSNGELYGAYVLNGVIHFIPYADGIFDADIPAPNDWHIMSKYMCMGIAKAKLVQSGPPGVPNVLAVGGNVSICREDL